MVLADRCQVRIRVGLFVIAVGIGSGANDPHPDAAPAPDPAGRSGASTVRSCVSSEVPPHHSRQRQADCYWLTNCWALGCLHRGGTLAPSIHPSFIIRIRMGIKSKDWVSRAPRRIKQQQGQDWAISGPGVLYSSLRWPADVMGNRSLSWTWTGRQATTMPPRLLVYNNHQR